MWVLAKNVWIKSQFTQHELPLVRSKDNNAQKAFEGDKIAEICVNWQFFKVEYQNCSISQEIARGMYYFGARKGFTVALISVQVVVLKLAFALYLGPISG